MNQKGGSGKTIASANLAAALREKGHRYLAVGRFEKKRGEVFPLQKKDRKGGRAMK